MTGNQRSRSGEGGRRRGLEWGGAHHVFPYFTGKKTEVCGCYLLVLIVYFNKGETSIQWKIIHLSKKETTHIKKKDTKSIVPDLIDSRQLTYR